MTITQITFEQFSRETKGAKCVSGGEMFGGGSFSEFGFSDERNATHRFEMDSEGNGKWFRIGDVELVCENCGFSSTGDVCENCRSTQTMLVPA